MSTDTKRQLAAVMFTDIVGYTALMQGDEQRAAQQRAKHRKIFEAQHRLHEGVIVQYYGDGTLSVFTSAVQACECAIQIQQQLRQGDPVPLRIGLHLGDIVFDQTEVYGDAVNLASRIESFGTPGSILLSGSINGELKNKPSIATVSLGAFEFKNVADPVEVFAIVHRDLVLPSAATLGDRHRRSQKSIAVLPFVNRSSDQDHEYFSDGITEEIINALSQIDQLKVTSRTSSFYFKGKNLPIKQIAKELDVSTILEGSVRIAGDNMRITAQLIDAEEDTHFWSETWNRRLENIFVTQDEISLSIADKLREQFGHFEIQDRLVDKQTASLKAYELYLKGRFHLNKWNQEDAKRARDLYAEAVAIDPLHAQAYAGLADAYSFLGTTGFVPYDQAWAKSHEYLVKAQALEKNLPEVHFQLGSEAYFIEGDYLKSLSILRQAVDARPNYAPAHQFLSFLGAIAGRFELAHKHIELALSIDPMSMEAKFFKGHYTYMTGDITGGLDYLNECIQANEKNIPAHSVKAMSLLCLGQYDAAIRYFDEVPQESVIPEEKYGIKMLGHLGKGEKEEADAFYQQVTARLDGPNAITASSFVFFRLAAMQDFDAAFAWLETALEKNSYVPSMRINDPLVAALRDDPRFTPMQHRIFQLDQTQATTPVKKPLMADDAATIAVRRVLDHLAEDEPFLDPDLTLRQLADGVDLPANQLSWLINAKLNKNFNDLINHHRIERFKSLAANPAKRNLTIMGLAYESGFNSKTTFNTSFKKMIGMTPREFMQANQ